MFTCQPFITFFALYAKELKMLKDILYTGLGMGVVLKERVQHEIQKR